MVDVPLLHDGGWEWERVLPLLEADPRLGRVITPDMPRRGASRPVDLGHIRLRDYVAAAVDALREHDLSHAVVDHAGGGIGL
jgi:pimeloyl-ACP methyl ester carboxylesterase